MSRQGDDQSQGMLVPILFVGTAFATAFYFTALQIPTVQYIMFLAYVALRIAGAFLTFNLTAANKLIETFFALAEGMKKGLKPNAEAIWQGIQKAAPDPLLTGLVVSTFFGLITAIIFLRRKNISEDKIVKSQKRKTLEETAKEWGIDPSIFQEKNLVKLASNFAEIRKLRNIPPNVIARKINDPDKRMAILHFDRVLKFNETLKRITDPDEVQRISRETMPREAGSE